MVLVLTCSFFRLWKPFMHLQAVSIFTWTQERQTIIIIFYAIYYFLLHYMLSILEWKKWRFLCIQEVETKPAYPDICFAIDDFDSTFDAVVSLLPRPMTRGGKIVGSWGLTDGSTRVILVRVGSVDRKHYVTISVSNMITKQYYFIKHLVNDVGSFMH